MVYVFLEGLVVGLCAGDEFVFEPAGYGDGDEGFCVGVGGGLGFMWHRVG